MALLEENKMNKNKIDAYIKKEQMQANNDTNDARKILEELNKLDEGTMISTQSNQCTICLPYQEMNCSMKLKIITYEYQVSFLLI